MTGGGNLVIFAHVFNIFVCHGVQCVKQLVAAAAAAEMIFFGFGNFQLVGMKQAGKNFFGGKFLVKNFFGRFRLWAKMTASFQASFKASVSSEILPPLSGSFCNRMPAAFQLSPSLSGA